MSAKFYRDSLLVVLFLAFGWLSRADGTYYSHTMWSPPFWISVVVSMLFGACVSSFSKEDE